MNKRTFYIKAFGLMIIGSIGKAAIHAVASSISAPETVVHNHLPAPKNELTVVKDDDQS